MSHPSLLRRCMIAGVLAGSLGSVQAQSAEEPVRAYLECAKNSVSLIDDRVSDATTIATGLHAQCRSSFLDVGINADRQSHLAEVLRPNLVQFVLLSRTAATRSKAPAKAPVNKPNL